VTTEPDRSFRVSAVIQAELERPAQTAPHLMRLTLVGLLLLVPIWGRDHAARLPWLYLVMLACAVALFATPLARAIAQRWRVLDMPAARKVHEVATPLLGGAAVYCGFAVTVLTSFDFSLQLKGVVIGATIVVAIGILDDLTDLPATLKLAGHIAGATAAIAYGVVLNVVPISVPGFAWINVALTILWFVTVTNAVQFLDGMDGLAAGLGVIAGLFFSIAALQTDQRYLMYLSAALVGACLGFLPYNFRPGRAQIFLGDSGATFIGFTLAGLAVMGEWAEGDPIIALLTPSLILGVPLFDIAFVGVARIVTGKVHSLHEWLAYTGRDHIHHRFEALGLTRKQSVLLIFFLASTLGLSAILLKDATPHEAVLILIQAACVLAIVAVLEGVGRWRPRP
jgi:UDP-GlcNAc:undecaprenyl-phosphate GlcNAc-1-phosphate transferase